MSTPHPAPHPTVLVLASGRGERFRAAGGNGHKLNALLGGVPVLQRTLSTVQASGLPWHLEDGRHPGMGDAIACAVRATQHAGSWLILPGDLPLVQPDTLRQVAQQLLLHPQHVITPLYRGQRGHPVGFPDNCLPALLSLSGDRGANAIVSHMLQLCRVMPLEVDDVGCVTDIDTPADLEAAAQWL